MTAASACNDAIHAMRYTGPGRIGRPHAELPRLLPTLSLPGDSGESSRRMGEDRFRGEEVGEPLTQTLTDTVPLPERTSTGLGL